MEIEYLPGQLDIEAAVATAHSTDAATAKLRELCADPAHSLELGKAAEHIACADVILQGYRCYLSDQGLPYDLIIDVSGRLLRVQVKAATFTKNVNAQGRAKRIAYSFHARRRGKFTSKRLGNSECDLVAFVALDIKKVAYLALRDCGQTVQLMPPGHTFSGLFSRKRWSRIDSLPLDQALARLDGGEGVAEKDLGHLEYNGERKSLTAWGRQYGISGNLISSRLARGWSVHRALTLPPSTTWTTRRFVREDGGERA